MFHVIENDEQFRCGGILDAETQMHPYRSEKKNYR